MNGRWLAGLLTCLTLSQAAADARLEGRELTFIQNDQAIFKRAFPEELGDLVGPAQLNDQVYLGVGPVVFAFDERGTLLGRADLPGMISSLDASSGVVQVSSLGQGYEERFTLKAPEKGVLQTQQRVVPAPIPEATGWLAKLADSVPPSTPADVLKQISAGYPDNPFLAVREAQLAQAAGDFAGAQAASQRALQAHMPFPAWTQLAMRLDKAGFPTAASKALWLARLDAAQRGYDPEVPISRAVLKAYGDPLAYIEGLFAENRVDRLALWMKHLRELHPRFAGGAEFYERYARLLDAQDRQGEAQEWRTFARNLRTGTIYNLGSQDLAIVRDTARLLTFALLLALAAAIITLAAKAIRTQLADTQALGGWWPSWRRPLYRIRMTSLSYASVSERLVLVLLSAGAVIALAGWKWADLTEKGLQAQALNMGTYGGGWYAAQLDHLRLRSGVPETLLLSGLTAQLEGDETEAFKLYKQAGAEPCALNNLGVIALNRENLPEARQLFRTALALKPDQLAAQYNLKLRFRAPELEFQETYRPGEPRLCYPDRRAMGRAISGDLQTVYRQTTQDPLAVLTGRQVWGRLDWAMILTMLFTAYLTLIFLLPRASKGPSLGRPPAYQFLGMTLPGSNLLDNAWGAVLLFTWAACAIGLLGLMNLLDFSALLSAVPGLSVVIVLLLVLTYALNASLFMLHEQKRNRKAKEALERL